MVLARWTDTWPEHCHSDAARAASLLIKHKCINSKALQGQYGNLYHLLLCDLGLNICSNVCSTLYQVSKRVCQVPLSHILEKRFILLPVIINNTVSRKLYLCTNLYPQIHLAGNVMAARLLLGMFKSSVILNNKSTLSTTEKQHGGVTVNMWLGTGNGSTWFEVRERLRFLGKCWWSKHSVPHASSHLAFSPSNYDHHLSVNLDRSITNVNKAVNSCRELMCYCRKKTEMCLSICDVILF